MRCGNGTLLCVWGGGLASKDRDTLLHLLLSLLFSLQSASVSALSPGYDTMCQRRTPVGLVLDACAAILCWYHGNFCDEGVSGTTLGIFADENAPFFAHDCVQS